MEVPEINVINDFFLKQVRKMPSEDAIEYLSLVLANMSLRIEQLEKIMKEMEIEDAIE